MPKFVAVVGASDTYSQPTDHIFERVIEGDLQSARERLIRALKRIGYTVVTEQPLLVKRHGQPSSCSFNVLKCVKSLTIGLSEVNSTSTLATFDYEIINSFVTKGDRKTTELEADAIIALAEAYSAPSICRGCGTGNTRDSHFCRVCGAHTAIADPAELEVLRLTSGARPANQLIILGFVTAIITAALAMLILLFAAKPPRVGLSVLVAGEMLAAWLFTFGIWRLHRTLNPARPESESFEVEASRLPKSAVTAALPPASERASVTEGTTELLVPREREPVPVRIHEVDTAEIR